MSYIDYNSPPAIKSELLLFQNLPTQTAIESYYDVIYSSNNIVHKSQNLEFNIPASDDFTDISELWIYSELKVENQNKGAILATNKVYPAENFGNALFQQIDFIINGKNICPANNTYAYQAYFEDKLFKFKNPIDYGFMDGPKEEMTARLQKNIDLYFKIHIPLVQQNLLLPSGLPIDIKITKNKDSFPLYIAAEEVEVTGVNIKINKAEINVRRVKLYPDCQESLIKALRTKKANYNIVRNEVKAFTITRGFTSFTLDNLFNGPCPRRILIGFVSDDSFNGEIKSDPFKFQDFGLTNISLNVDGTQVPSNGYTFDFGGNMYIKEFVNLFRVFNQHENTPQLDYSYAKFKESPLFAFDLTPDCTTGGESGHLNLLKRASIRVDLKFKSALTSSIHMIVFSQHDNIIHIDEFRNIEIDY